jgi:cell division protein FtsI (penicillin-binding protein 3)
MKKLLTPTAVRGVNYATSPLLASKTPNWRSRFVVAAGGAGLCRPAGRAAQMQLVKPEFFQKEGEKRFVHSLEVPATRGRMLDRSGQLLATSVPVPSGGPSPRT